ncbi:MAG TPA: acireductone synthase [Pyrinomonadaceae bacterium]|nr:acireductone synthase [Pyrinomonadaceae bacterium]
MTDAKVNALLLDIEGTTTPIAFVYEVLFPFAHQHAKEFIEQHRDSADVLRDIAGLKDDYLADVAAGNEPPLWRDEPGDSSPESVTTYVQWQIKQDRKSTALKSLQGKIWEAGYLKGRLRGRVFADVPVAFARWRKQAKRIYIYSSGSILAQKLLFANTNYGDLSGYIENYFDTTSGAKRAVASYQSIAQKIALSAREILFLSDVSAELDAARSAGMQTRLCVRPGNAKAKTTDHLIIHTFDVL